MNKLDFFNTANHYKFVVDQLSSLKVKDLIVADLGRKDVASFRMNLHKYSFETNTKFKTKVSEGKLYVGRTK